MSDAVSDEQHDPASDLVDAAAEPIAETHATEALAADSGDSGDAAGAGVGDSAGGAEPFEAPSALSESDQALLDLTGERDQYKDIALRLQADFENYRKRVAKDQIDAAQRATEKLAEALLPVLDACEAAFLQHPAEIEPIFNLMLGELRKQGLEALNLQGQPFDPAVADAVMHEAGDEADGPIVAEVLRSGYIWKGRVLRPAMVKVRG